MAMPVVSELAELYNGSDAAAIACLNSKLAVEKLYSSHLEETRQAVQQKVWRGKGVGGKGAWGRCTPHTWSRRSRRYSRRGWTERLGHVWRAAVLLVPVEDAAGGTARGVRRMDEGEIAV